MFIFHSFLSWRKDTFYRMSFVRTRDAWSLPKGGCCVWQEEGEGRINIVMDSVAWQLCMGPFLTGQGFSLLEPELPMEPTGSVVLVGKGKQVAGRVCIYTPRT